MDSTVPSMLGRQQIAKQILSRLQASQEQALHLELLQIANGHEDTDPLPGAEPKTRDGKILYEDDRPVYPTYGEVQADLAAGAARVMARAVELGVVPLVESMRQMEAAASMDGRVL
jgi:hypothetical protein